jgi:prolyl oligopeptidase
MAVPPYPTAPRLDLVEDRHGVAVADPYRWLEDPADPHTVAWSAAQDEFYMRARTGWAGVDGLARTLRDLLRTGSVGAPVWRGERVFASRREPDAEHPVLTVADGGGPRRVLVDPAALDPSGTTTLDGWSPSREGDLVAVQLSRGGTEESELLVLDAGTGDLVDGPIDRTRYSPVAWLPREAGAPARFYYVRRLPPDAVPDGERQYHRRVRLHTVGVPAVADVEVFGADLPKTSYFGVWTRDDGRWLVVSASDGTAPRTDVWLADLGGSPPESPELRPVAVGLDAQHAVWVGRDDRLYAHTDLDAPRGRLCVADPAAPGHEHWRDLVGEDPGAVLSDAALLDGPDGPGSLLAVTRTRHGVSELALHRAADGAPGPAAPALPGLGSLGGLRTRPGGGTEAWLTYTDDSTPGRVLRLDTAGPDPRLDVHELPPGEPPDGPSVTSRQVVATSPDGTAVRAVVVTRTDALTDDDRPRAPAPTVLSGYGGFGISMTPGYSASVLAWVRAGGVWATAQLRGGGEEGEAWHRAGMLAAKQNVFDDFHAVAGALVAGGWTSPPQLAASGGSNGGLLVGAALTQRPEAFAAVLCSAPLLDMVRYHRHGLGATWTSEYGDPDDAEEFAWVHAYSPYHRVIDGPGGVAYPAVLFTVFDGDTRVDPFHARKMCAALQHATASDPARRPVLLRREADVGHAQRSLSRSVRLSAEGLAFLADVTGLTWTRDR